VLEPLVDLAALREPEELTPSRILSALVPRTDDGEVDVRRILAPMAYHARLRAQLRRDRGLPREPEPVLGMTRFNLSNPRTNNNHGFWLIVHFFRTCMLCADRDFSWVDDSLGEFFGGERVCAECVAAS
jgi:hypothetical protein